MNTLRMLAFVVVSAGFCWLQSAPALAQTDFYIPIYVEDGSGWKDSVLIGKYEAATDGPGDALSPLLTENELPPAPPIGAPDLRVISPPGGADYGLGMEVDIRHLAFDGQKNLYRLSFRMSTPGATGIVISWPAGLDSVSAGGFYLTDSYGGVYFDPVNMAAATSFSHPWLDDTLGRQVDILIGSGAMHRTFTPTEIALAEDLKGKVGKLEKPKPTSVDFHFDLTAAGGETELYLAFDKVVEGTISFENDTTGRLPISMDAGVKVYGFDLGLALAPGVVLHVEGQGNRGKAMKSKYGFGPPATKASLAVPSPYVGGDQFEYLRLPAPNINNIGSELYAQSANVGVGLPFQIGITPKGKPIFRNIGHPAWKDVTKTLHKYKKGVTMLQDGPASCLDMLNSKVNLKTLKYLSPDKANRVKYSGVIGNKLIGEMVALKFNIAASEYGHTPSTGFGGLQYTNPGHAFDGFSVAAIAHRGDEALSCVSVADSAGLPTGWTEQDMADFLSTLNEEFSGAFDTVSWSGISTVASGVKPLVLSDLFIDTINAAAPAPRADARSLYEVPASFELTQNYPNPFNPTTTIGFSIPDDAFVTLKVFNLLGQEVAILADREEFGAGANEIELDGAKLSTGVYYYRIDVNDGQYESVRKMVLLK